MIFREFQNSSLVQLLVYSTPVNAMNEQSEDKCDRELFSELLEPPIHPLLIHIVPPFIEENNPVFALQMNGEAAWRLREMYWPPQKVFELFQTSIMPLGYRLTESSRDRVGRTKTRAILSRASSTRTGSGSGFSKASISSGGR